MNANHFFIGLMVFLTLLFVWDLLSRRRQLPRPKPVEQRELPAPSAPPEAIVDAPQARVESALAPVKAAPLPVPEPAPLAPKAAAPTPEVSFMQRMRQGLGKTRATLGKGLADLLLGKKAVDADLLEEVETLLVTADLGMTVTQEIIRDLTARLERKQLAGADAFYAALRDDLSTILARCEAPLTLTTPDGSPFVILVVGVNGAGKTTTIGKLAHRFKSEGKSVMLAAGDTFRAAAVEQLQTWGERNQVPVIAQQTGADSASVIFDAVQAAKARHIDVVIADTAGRLQNKDNLMAELEKVVRVMKKLDVNAPHEVLLVLDAGTGQNALSQAQVFGQAVGVSGIALTKLDGTAKGGIIFAIARQLGLPIRFIGVGEQAEDLRPFVARDYVDALFE